MSSAEGPRRDRAGLYGWSKLAGFATGGCQSAGKRSAALQRSVTVRSAPLRNGTALRPPSLATPAAPARHRRTPSGAVTNVAMIR